MEGWAGVALMMLLGASVGLGGLVISSLVGPRNPTPEKMAAYECGMPPVGDARERQSIKFYLVAMIFLLFDIEVAFLYPWVVAFDQLSLFAIFAMITFLLLLCIAYFYEYKRGGMEWD